MEILQDGHEDERMQEPEEGHCWIESLARLPLKVEENTGKRRTEMSVNSVLTPSGPIYLPVETRAPEENQTMIRGESEEKRVTVWGHQIS